MRVTRLKPQNVRALIAAYYLARFDKQSYTNLGYSSFSDAYHEIGKLLGVRPTTIKNMRDEFDYHVPNSRIGWKDELRGSRLEIVQMFQMTDDDELLEIVKEILENEEWVHTEAYRLIGDLLSRSKKKTRSEGNFSHRGITGRKAEEYYKNYFSKASIPARGELVDCRDQGCGYDFMIKGPDDQYSYIEVKGLSEGEGGISFTNKEWKIARQYGDKYFLVIVSHLSSKPQIDCIQHPASNLKPKKNLNLVVQVSWNISIKDIPKELGKQI